MAISGNWLGLPVETRNSRTRPKAEISHMGRKSDQELNQSLRMGYQLNFMILVTGRQRCPINQIPVPGTTKI